MDEMERGWQVKYRCGRGKMQGGSGRGECESEKDGGRDFSGTGSVDNDQDIGGPPHFEKGDGGSDIDLDSARRGNSSPAADGYSSIMPGKSPEIDDYDPWRRKSSLEIEDDYGKQGGSQRNGATPDNDDGEVKGSPDKKDDGSGKGRVSGCSSRYHGTKAVGKQ